MNTMNFLKRDFQTFLGRRSPLLCSRPILPEANSPVEIAGRREEVSLNEEKSTP
jgi:hypothetical protein